VKFTISIPRESCTNAKAKYSSSVVPPDPSVHFYHWVALHYYYTSPSRWCTTHEVSKLLISQRLPHYQPAHFYPCSDADIAKAASRPSSARSATAATACRSYIARRVGRRTDVSTTWYDVGRLRPDRQTDPFRLVSYVPSKSCV